MRYSNFSACVFDKADNTYSIYNTLNAFIFQVLIANSVVTVLVGSMVVLALIVGPRWMVEKDVAQPQMATKIHS